MYLKLNQTIDETINKIKYNISKGIPLSFSRYGDGEIYLLNRNSPSSHQKRKCNDWDYKHPEEIDKLYDDSTKSIITSIKGSDIIGIIDKNNEICKTINCSEKIWSIKTELLENHGINTDKLIITDHMLPRSRKFGEIKNFKEILQGKSLNIISPNTKILKEKNLGKILDSEVTYTHHPYSVNFKNKNEFVKKFKDIKSDVVLVGTGNIKDYVVDLKNNYGKIAIDVGALLDAWADVKSRPWFMKGSKQDYLRVK